MEIHSDTDLFNFIEQEKSTFKIVTKTKNESFFIEKWIIHHLNIVQDTKLIIFDNMSDDKFVHSIYRKYRDNIILVKFDIYMDCIHMPHNFIKLYKALSASSKFFTIIDTDEYLYLYDNGKIINDNSIVKFLDNNTDCNFFTPCWMENIIDNEMMIYFNLQNLSQFHWSKPILNAKTIPMFELALTKNEYTEIHHTLKLPIFTYGKTKTNFLLIHLKNLNKYQRIKTNMNKLTALKFVNNDKDFSTLLKIDLNTIHDTNLNTLIDENTRQYIIETRNIIESLHSDAQCSDKHNTVELLNDGKLKFSSDSDEYRFKELMNSDYFDLINFDPNTININPYAKIESFIH